MDTTREGEGWKASITTYAHGCYATVRFDRLEGNWKNQMIRLEQGQGLDRLGEWHQKLLTKGGYDLELFCSCEDNSFTPIELLPDLEAAYATYHAAQKAERDDRKACKARVDQFISEVLNPDDLTVTVLDRWRHPKTEEGGDFGCMVEVRSKATGESLRFKCRNIFDFGYVVNPDYSISPGSKPGGLANCDNEGRWYWDVAGMGGESRDLTEFEHRAVLYLDLHPPVADSLRM